MSKVILGDGLLGKYLQEKTGWDYISRKKDGIDFSNIDSYKKLLKNYGEIINCIANTDTYSEDKKSHWDVNFKGVADLTDYCAIENKKLVHISTDYLYANSKEDASEDDVPVHCANWYGYTKLLSDGYVQLKGKKYLLIRTTQKKSPFTYDYAYINQKGNFDYIDKIGDMIIELINKNAIGLYNVGTEKKTMYDLALETKSDVKPTEELFNKTMPTNTTMNIDTWRDFLKK